MIGDNRAHDDRCSFRHASNLDADLRLLRHPEPDRPERARRTALREVRQAAAVGGQRQPGDLRGGDPCLAHGRDRSLGAVVRAVPDRLSDARRAGPRNAGRLKVVKVNVDENQDLARRFDALSIPTIVVLRDGTVVNRIVGALPKPQLEAQVKPYLKPPKAKT